MAAKCCLGLHKRLVALLCEMSGTTVTSLLDDAIKMQIDKPVVEILMATFNGAQFLAQQIESILAQDYQQFRIVIRDDGSTDDSLGIIKTFIEQHPEKIALLNDVRGHLGASLGFMALLQNSNADYVMFADQDDVWLPEKISMSMAEMEQSEVTYGKNMPILIHSDLIVTDKALSVVSGSFWKYQGLSPECVSINRLLVQNVVTGCTAMMNRSLVNLVRPVDSGMIGHDWWLGLLASAFGKIIYLPQATMLYRQHGKNAVGAVKWNVSGMLGKFFDVDTHRMLADRLRKTRQQAAQFSSIYGDILPQNAYRIILRYATLHELSYFSRIICVLRYRFFKVGIFRNIGMMLILRTT